MFLTRWGFQNGTGCSAYHFGFPIPLYLLKMCRSDPTERVQRTSGAAEKDLVHEVRAALDRPVQVQLRL